MPTESELRRILARIDGRGYKAYREISGSYDFQGWVLHVDHVQGDPFAAPSKIRLRVYQDVAKLPASLFSNPVRKMAFEDFLARQVRHAIKVTVRGNRGSGKSGLITIDAGAQEVLERTAVVIATDWVEARLQVGLPAAGRTVLGRQAETMLCSELHRITQKSLFWRKLAPETQRQGEAFVHCVENQEHIRSRLAELGLVAFVADGAILPRESGVLDSPLSRRAVKFSSPESLRMTIGLPNPIAGKNDPADVIAGAGIRRGITLIVGGGYHGKSTFLKALERGVYPHVPGDGREYVVTCSDAVKIRAEDGRRVERVDISPFISELPYGRSTVDFSTDDASGSTSQAANIMEALEMGATALLLDEDTSATNFMIRDSRMQELVHKKHEPITPFLDRIREIYEELGVSTVLVMGGCGDYFDVADAVIMMRDYLPADVSAEARGIARAHPTRRLMEAARALTGASPRVPIPESFDPSRGRREVKIDIKDLDLILFGRERIDLRSVEQLVDPSQTNAIGHAIYLAAARFMDGKATLREVVQRVEEMLNREGMDVLDPFHRPERNPGNYARPRKHEIASAINRLRTVRMRMPANMSSPGGDSKDS
jgi:predicted ABC-class ATPase